MKFKEFLKEDFSLKVKTKGRFEDSSEATSYVSSISSVLKSPALLDWCKRTDENFDTNSVRMLNDLIKRAEKFTDEILEAGT